MTLTGHNDSVLCLLQLRDGRLASASGDKSIKLWNLITNECLITLIGHSRSVNYIIQFSDDRLISGSGDKTIMIWDT